MSQIPVPTTGRMVYYVAYGTPGGEYKPGAERAAVVSQVNEDGTVGLVILNPTGLFFNISVKFDQETKKPGTWHWMPYQLQTAGTRHPDVKP
jgi:hypothetical protein